MAMSAFGDTMDSFSRQLLQSGSNLLLANATTSENAGFNFWYQDFANLKEQAVCIEADKASWLKSLGTETEGNVSQGCQWLALALCLFNMGFYGYHWWKATTGWEEIYVVLIEMVKVCLELTHEYDSPATLYLVTGNTILWIRFGEWLLTCPVILIHLSNITGLKDDYNKRTMLLLVSDLGTIVCGVTSALSTTFVKWIFFFMGLSYGCNTYFHAAKVYVESYHIVPKGVCRNLVRAMAWCFFVAWTMFPLLFVFGPEGFGIMSRQGSNIAHTVADILSKQTWSFLGHMLRVKIHEHIIIHGNITKPTKINVAGMEMEAETMVEADDDEGVNHGTKHLANRESFLLMKERMQKQGIDCRASFDDSDAGRSAAAKGKELMMMGSMMGGMGGVPAAAAAPLESGRVILAVPDISMVDFFRQQFAALPAPIELVPALGADNALALVQQAMQMGGLDCVLVHPEFLRDRSSTGLVNRLRSAGQRVIAFGWAPIGPVRELIETSGVDGYLEGPSFGTPINTTQLVMVLSRVQQIRKMAMMNSMMMMGGNPMMNQMGMMGANPLYGTIATPQNVSMTGAISPMGANMNSGNLGNMGMMGAGMGSQGMAGMGMAGMGMGMGMMGSPSMTPAAGAAGLSGTPGATTPGAGTPGAGAGNQPSMNEAEMLQQLMSEINRLKSELGEN